MDTQFLHGTACGSGDCNKEVESSAKEELRHEINVERRIRLEELNRRLDHILNNTRPYTLQPLYELLLGLPDGKLQQIVPKHLYAGFKADLEELHKVLHWTSLVEKIS